MFQEGQILTESQAHALNTLRKWFNDKPNNKHALNKAAIDMIKECLEVEKNDYRIS